jgi:hypothetical protein
MEFRNGEHSVHALQILNVAVDRLFVHVKDRHQIRPQVRDVKLAVDTVQTLVIETSRTASQRHIGQSAQGNVTGRCRLLSFVGFRNS